MDGWMDGLLLQQFIVLMLLLLGRHSNCIPTMKWHEREYRRVLLGARATGTSTRKTFQTIAAVVLVVNEAILFRDILV
jgi:hypothetical protein